MTTDPESPLSEKPTLTGERVELRPFIEADLPAMAAATHDPDVTRWTEYDLDTSSLDASGLTEVDERLVPHPSRAT